MYLLFIVIICTSFVNRLEGFSPFKTLLYSDWITSFSISSVESNKFVSRKTLNLDFSNNSNFGALRWVCNSDSTLQISAVFVTQLTGDHRRDLSFGTSDIQIYLYDFQNNFNITYPIDEAVDGITQNYNLDITRKLIFFVPGYKSHISKKTEELVRQTFKDVANIYLIIVDHSIYTSARGGKIKSYERSVTYSYYIGKVLGQFLARIRADGFPSKNIHCIGHSLGSQMLGYAGTTYTEMTGEKIWRVTGIDPAGPCFSNSLIENQIRSGVGEYVEVYHCNAEGLGTTAVLADTDFFFNKKGKKQPSCHGSIIPGKGDSDVAKCSHKACVRYYMMTVHQPQWFLAWRCDDYDNFSEGKCSGNEVTIAGYSNPGNATGVFYVSTETYGVV